MRYCNVSFPRGFPIPIQPSIHKMRPTCYQCQNETSERHIWIRCLITRDHILRDTRPSTAAWPARWAMGTKELKLCMVRKKYFILGRLQQPRQNKSILYRHDKPNKPAKEGPLSFVLFESPFIPVSTVSRGHPSVISLHITKETDSQYHAY